MAVKVKKLDQNGNFDGVETHEAAAHIAVSDGVLSVSGPGEYKGHGGEVIAIYQKGFWTAAVVG